MAVRTPILSTPNASAAVQTAAPDPLKALVPKLTEQVAGAVLEHNAQSKVSEAAQDFAKLRQTFQEGVPGSPTFPSTEASLNAFNEDASRLAAMRFGGMSEDRFKSESEKILRKHIARAPGLAEQFQSTAKGTLGFDPTGAGLEETFNLLQVGKEQSKDITNIAIQNARDVGAVLEINKFLRDGDVLGLVDRTSKYAAAHQRKELLDNVEAVDKTTSVRAARGIGQYYSETFTNNVLQTIPDPELRDKIEQAYALGNDVQLSEDDRAVLRTTIAAAKNAALTDPAWTRHQAALSSTEREVSLQGLNDQVAHWENVINGEYRLQDMETSIKLSQRDVYQEINADPNRKAMFAKLSFINKEVPIIQSFLGAEAAELTGSMRPLVDSLTGKYTAIQDLGNSSIIGPDGRPVADYTAFYSALREHNNAIFDALPAGEAVIMSEELLEQSATKIEDAKNPEEARIAITAWMNAYVDAQKKSGADLTQARQNAARSAGQLLQTSSRQIGADLRKLGLEKDLKFKVEDGKLTPTVPSNDPRVRKALQVFNNASTLLAEVSGQEDLDATIEQLVLSNVIQDVRVNQQLQDLIPKLTERKAAQEAEDPIIRSLRVGGARGMDLQAREIQKLREQIKALEEQQGLLVKGSSEETE